MRVAMTGAMVLLAMVVASGPALAGGEAKTKDSEAIAILKVAMANEKDLAVLTKALADLDALAVKQPKDADTHYARGWVLSHLGRVEPSVAAYDKAFDLDKTLTSAAYNAGVVLAAGGRNKESLIRFERALAVDPKFVDAAYNAGQGYYNAQEFAKAAERWETVIRLAPNDFEAAKKLVQAYVALGKDAEVAKARERVFALKKAAKVPGLAKMKSYVYDQFDVGAHHVYVYEPFEISGDITYVYKFVVSDHDRMIGSVTLETRTAMRENAAGYMLGIDKSGGVQHSFRDKIWTTLPAYRVIKAEATKKIEANF